MTAATAPFNRSTRTRRSADRDVVLHIRTSEAVATALRRMATDQFRSPHATARKVLVDQLVAGGYLPAKHGVGR